VLRYHIWQKETVAHAVVGLSGCAYNMLRPSTETRGQQWIEQPASEATSKNINALNRPNVGHYIYISRRRIAMLRWALIFLVVALIAAVLGFGGVAGAAAGIAKFLFFLFVVLFVLALIFGRRVLA
jgi:uncharacterized membrane protein YtjA (UPF0391 family)